MTAGEKMKRDILDMGLTLWRVDPAYVTARRIARELGIVHGTVFYHFSRGERSLKDAVAFYSVQQGESKVIAYLIGVNHKAIQHMDDEEKLKHLHLAKDR